MSALIDMVAAPDALQLSFQPIFRLDALPMRLEMVEGLVRGPTNSNFGNAEVLFEYVRRKCASALFDRVCLQRVFTAAAEFPIDTCFSANVTGSSLYMKAYGVDLLRLLEHLKVAPARFVLEIVEQQTNCNNQGFASNLLTLRSEGVRIALDDFGFGHANLAMMIDLRPEFIKLDRRIVTGCRGDRFREMLISDINRFSSEFELQVIAEGIENEADLASMRELKIALVQGFGLARPIDLSWIPKSLPSYLEGWRELSAKNGRNPSSQPALANEVEQSMSPVQ